MESTPILEHATGEVLRKIREEINEDANKKDQDLASIKEWLRMQPHLPDEWEDMCLLTFLRGTKFSLEKCKKKLETYFTMRNVCPEFYSNKDISRPELMDLMTKIRIVVLPEVTPRGKRVTIYMAHNKTLHSDILSDAIKITTMIGDIRVREETVGISGDVHVFDASILTLNHIATVSLSVIRKFFICVLEAYPVRLTEIHIINASPIIEMLLNLIKPFIKAKIFDRIIIHSDISGLLDYIPKDMLPVDFGGNGKSMETLQKLWLQKLVDYTPWFEAQEQVKANESLRLGKPIDYDELFGVEGSFRSLSID